MQWLWSLVSSGVVGGLVVWIVKKLVDDALKNQRVELKATLDRQKAVFDAAIGKQAFEHQTVYPRLHQKTMDVITESYERLSKFVSAVVAYTELIRLNGDKPYDEKLKVVAETFLPFKQYFEANKIFIPDQAAKEIAADFQKMVGKANVWQFMVHMQDDRNVDWQQMHKMVSEEMPPIIENLERVYRSLVKIELVYPDTKPDG
jgi:hypothetical protein